LIKPPTSPAKRKPRIGARLKVGLVLPSVQSARPDAGFTLPSDWASIGQPDRSTLVLTSFFACHLARGSSKVRLVTHGGGISQTPRNAHQKRRRRDHHRRRRKIRRNIPQPPNRFAAGQVSRVESFLRAHPNSQKWIGWLPLDCFAVARKISSHGKSGFNHACLSLIHCETRIGLYTGSWIAGAHSNVLARLPMVAHDGRRWRLGALPRVAMVDRPTVEVKHAMPARSARRQN
jgi:hypothetical protein